MDCHAVEISQWDVAQEKSRADRILRRWDVNPFSIMEETKFCQFWDWEVMGIKYCWENVLRDMCSGKRV